MTFTQSIQNDETTKQILFNLINNSINEYSDSINVNLKQ